MAIEIFAPLVGLVTALGANLYFYLRAYEEDKGFTGLLKMEEEYLMDTAVALGALQMLYFVWRSVGEVFVVRTIPEVVLGVVSLGLFSLGIFAYRSLSLLNNMEKVEEKYGFDIDWGDLQ